MKALPLIGIKRELACPSQAGWKIAYPLLVSMCLLWGNTLLANDPAPQNQINLDVNQCQQSIKIGDQDIPCYLLRQINQQLVGETDCLHSYKLDFEKGNPNKICLNTSELIFDKAQKNLIDYTGEFDAPKGIEILDDKLCITGVRHQSEGLFVLHAGFRNRYQFNRCRTSSIRFKAKRYSYYQDSDEDDTELVLSDDSISSNPTSTSYCMTFSKALKAKQNLDALVSVEEVINEAGAKTKVDVIRQLEQNQICLLGLKPKQRYHVQIAEGLVGFHAYYDYQQKRMIETTIPLKNTISRDFKTAGLKQRILLSNQKYIMPADTQIFIRYFNTKQVEAKIYAVDERNFTRFFKDRSLNMLQQKMSEYYQRSYDTMNTMLEQEVGSLVWSGIYDLPEQAIGKEGTALLPIQGLKDRKNAIYLVLIQASSHNDPLLNNQSDAEIDRWRYENESFDDLHKIQWIIDTSIGLHASIVDEQLEINALDLQNNEEQSDLKVQILAKNNRVLAEAETDGDGKAFFPKALLEGKNADKASLIFAQNDKNEIAILDLESNQIMLSADDLSKWEDKQGFISTDREAYRPGEMVHIFHQMRNAFGKAEKLKLLIKLTKPNGELAKFIETESNAFGSNYQEYQLDRNAASGDWKIEAFDLLKVKEKLKKHYAEQNPTAVEPEEQKYLNEEYLQHTNLFLEAQLTKALFKVDSFILPNLQASAQIDWVKEKVGEDLLPPIEIKIKAQYMHGGSARGITVQPDIYFRKKKAPVKALEAYEFGDQGEKILVNLNIFPKQELDEKGEATIRIPSLPKPDSLSPRSLEARLVFNDSNGGTIERFVTLPVQITDSEIGIKGQFEKHQIIQGDEGEFEIIVTDHLGVPQSNQEILLSWQHLMEKNDYHDFWSENEQFDLHLLKQEKQVTNAEGKIKFKSEPLIKGFYLITAKHLKNKAISSYRFLVSDRWFYHSYDFDDEAIRKHNELFQYPKFKSTSNDPRDIPTALKYELKATNPENEIKLGEELSFESDLPADGFLKIMVLNQKKLWSFEDHFKAGKQSISIPVTEAWKNGVHLWVFFVRNGDQKYQHLPRRWTSAEWLISKKQHQPISLQLKPLPAVIRPLKNLELEYELKGLQDQKAQLLFWLVDESVLNLTQFKMKDIFAALLRPKALSMVLLDAYQHIMESFSTTLAKIKSGGDMELGDNKKGLSENQELLALSSGLIESNGQQAKVSFALPAFNGKARLMAYITSENQVGQFEQLLDIREEVTIDISAPRFLTNGDQAKVKVKVFYQDGEEGTVKLHFQESKALGLSAKKLEKQMKPGELWEEELLVKMQGEKGGRIECLVYIPNQEKAISKKQVIQNRFAWALKNEQAIQQISAGQELSITPFQSSQYNQLRLTISPLLPFDIAGMIKELNEYPYGCGEQITSKAFPQLSFETLIQDWQIDLHQEFHKTSAEFKEIKRAHIDHALNELSFLQKSDGKFSYWKGSIGDDDLTLYIMHFILELKRIGYPNLNAQLLFNGSQAVQKIATIPPTYLNIYQTKQKLYALYLQSVYQLGTKAEILAQIQALDFRINPASIVTGQSATYQYISTLINHAEIDLLRRAILSQFNESLHEISVLEGILLPQKAFFKHYQQYYITELSKLLYFSVHAKLSVKAQDELLFWIHESLSNQSYLSTSDKGWLLLALEKQGKRIQKKEFSVLLEKQELNSKQSLTRFYQNVENKKSFQIKNIGSQPLYISQKSVSLSTTPPAPYQSAFSVSKSFLDMQGNELSAVQLANGIESGKQMLVKLTVTQKPEQAMIYPYQGQILLVDLLAGGTTIEAVFNKQTKDLINSLSQGLRLCRFEEKQHLPDRFVLAFDPSKGAIVQDQNHGNTDGAEGEEEGEGEAAAIEVQDQNTCHFIYMIKSTIPGEYLMPGVFAEVMNQPSIFAQGEISRLRVLSY